jgi:hypothetical protein
MEAIMWEQIAHIGRFTAGRQQGLVWFVETWGTWRWEHWHRGDETWRSAGQAATEVEARAAVEARCGGS